MFKFLSNILSDKMDNDYDETVIAPDPKPNLKIPASDKHQIIITIQHLPSKQFWQSSLITHKNLDIFISEYEDATKLNYSLTIQIAPNSQFTIPHHILKDTVLKVETFTP
jgi:hypothetical protein